MSRRKKSKSARKIATGAPPQKPGTSAHTSSVSPEHWSGRTVWAALAGLLVVHVLFAVTGLRRKSATIDEVAHLPAGISYWQKASFALYHHNPPLVKMLSALPVLASQPVVDYTGSWAIAEKGGHSPSHAAFGAEFMRDNADRYFELYFRARYVIVALSALGGLLVFLWARELWGPLGGLVSAAVWALSPNVLAHAGLVTTDLGATVAGFAATYLFWRWLRRPSWGRAFSCGLLLGIAQLVKFSALLLYVLWPVLGFTWWLLRRRGDSAASTESHAGDRPLSAARRPQIVLQAILMPVLSILVINVGYGFEGTGKLLGGFPFLSLDLTVPRTGGTPARHPAPLLQQQYLTRQNRFEGTLLGALPVPLPKHYVLGFDEQRFETNTGLATGGYPVYLRGELRRTGWWYYYVYALLVKVPLGTWLLVATAIAAPIFLPQLRGRSVDEWVLAIPPLAILASMSFLTDINLGLRYVLPIFPFVFVSLGRLGRDIGQVQAGPIVLTALLGIGLGWNAAGAVGTWPHYLSYFNQAVGGPEQGHRHLIDSNLDWGQDLLELKRWLEEHPQPEPVWLAYCGTVDPVVAGVEFVLPARNPSALDPRQALPRDRSGPEPGLYAVSVNYVQGLPFRSYNEDGRVVPVPVGSYRYFQELERIDRAGYSIWLYRLSPEDVEELRVVWPETASSAP